MSESGFTRCLLGVWSFGYWFDDQFWIWKCES